jgi:hypothetical protein
LTLGGFAIWAWILWHWNVLWVVAIPAVLYQWRVNAALREHHDPLTSLQKRWLFAFQCFISGAFPTVFLVYALTTHSVLGWIAFGGFLLVMLAALYGGYRDLFINQT